MSFSQIHGAPLGQGDPFGVGSWGSPVVGDPALAPSSVFVYPSGSGMRACLSIGLHRFTSQSKHTQATCVHHHHTHTTPLSLMGWGGEGHWVLGRIIWANFEVEEEAHKLKLIVVCYGPTGANGMHLIDFALKKCG